MEKYCERIDKIISSTGKASRSEVKKAAKNGLVKLNGVTIKDCSKKATDADVLAFNGETIVYKKYIYIMLNKPKGYVCSTDDPTSPIVNELLSEEFQKLNLFSIGRLDKNTTGLVILTNDGTLAHRVISPSSNISKMYVAETKFDITSESIEAFFAGIILEDGYKCLPAKLELLSSNKCVVTIREGKYHQIKRMFEALCNKVVNLERISIGNLSLDTRLKQGDFRLLEDHEIAALCAPETIC